MRTARLVTVDDTKSDAENFISELREAAPSCATCKWAEPAQNGGLEPTVLRCSRLAPGVGYTEDQPDEVARVARVWREDPESAAWLTVKPTFGCVQWEGRE